MTNSRGGCLGFTLLASLLFLASPARAQDDKDREIEKLKVQLAAQQKLADRQAQEIESLRKTIAEREKEIVQLGDKVKEAKVAAANFELIAKTRQLQNENLLELVRELTKRLMAKEAGKELPKDDRKPDEPNPPAAKLDGKVSKVSGNLIEINLGTADGLKENHTLEVYRLQPMPKYIGRIRITDVRQNTSVARLLGKETPKEGDKVTSELK